MDTRVILKADPFTMNVDMYLGYRQGNSWMNITLDHTAQDIPCWPAMKVEEIEQGRVLPPDPYVRLPLSCLKSLRDELAKLGVVSETDEHIAGQLKAVLAHLEDMRKLVFNFKEVERGN
jgi:hypothetical protein